MSNPRPDPPRLAAIREALRNMVTVKATMDSVGTTPLAVTNYVRDVDALLADRDQLLSDLRTLEAQWRERAERAVETGYYANNGRSQAFEDVADDLAALLASLEGT